MTATMPVEIFIAYAHADEPLKDELLKHLSPLRREGLIREWHDRRIQPGADWEHQIDQHLNACGIVLLLISADFIHSDYCCCVEMKRALERHASAEATVVPVILRPCDWHRLPFGTLQALPKDGKAVSTWPNGDEAFTDIARGLRLKLSGGGGIGPEGSTPESNRTENSTVTPATESGSGKESVSVTQSQRSGSHSTNIQAGRDINIGGGEGGRK